MSSLGRSDYSNYYEHRIIHIDKTGRLTSLFDEYAGPVTPFIAALLMQNIGMGTYICGTNLYQYLSPLTEIFSQVPGWRMRISNRHRQAFTRDGRTFVSGQFFVDYLAIDNKRYGNSRELRQRRRIDVINLELFNERPALDTLKQIASACAILDLCKSRGVDFRATRGSLGSALLKASPNWHRGRKPAPQFINDFTRSKLPGNFYSVNHKRHSTSIPHCYYIDQSSSHHAIAKSIGLPHPERLRARGNFRQAIDREPTPWNIETGNLHNHIGLAYARVHIGTIAPSIRHLYPPWALQRGQQHIWLWTPELRLFENDHRIQLEHFVCAFTSTVEDNVLKEYAGWALDHLSASQNSQPVKPTLLAAYGMLAFNSRSHILSRYWGGISKGQPVTIPGLDKQVKETRVELPEWVQPSLTNVVARGVIEAETRTRSIEYARELHANGLTVAQIYADGILVEGEQLPFIWDGWRVSHSLTHVHIPRPNAIISDQLTKLPGHPLLDDERIWKARRREARRPMVYARVDRDLDQERSLG